MSTTDGGPRRRGRPRKWASDAERVRAWRAAERARRELVRDHPDVGSLVEAVTQAEAQRDANWRHVHELQEQVRRLTAEAPPPGTMTKASGFVLRQQVDDLVAVIAHLIGAGWDHPLFATVEARARRAGAEGRLLDRSVLDELGSSLPAGLRGDRSPEPPASSGPSRAERRRLEREERRRRR